MPLVEKRRVLKVDNWYSRAVSYDAATSNQSTGLGGVEYPPGNDSSLNIPVYSTQITRSEGHNWPAGRGVWDNGGPFESVKTTYNRLSPDRVAHYWWWSSGLFNHRYGTEVPAQAFLPTPFQGTSHTLETAGNWVSQPFGGPSNLDLVGSRFVTETIPTSPPLSASVSLAELFREGLPSMLGAALSLRSKVDFFRSLGSEYLNVEFGWKPIVSDVKAACKAIMESEDTMNRLVANSGKDLERKRLHPPERIAGTESITFAPSGMYTHIGWNSPPRYTTFTTAVRQQWFSGSYTYYIPKSSLEGISGIATRARLLYGLEITPEVLWNLAPWSWLVDWFANVGDLMHNVSAFQSDGLVLRHGYVMETTSLHVRRQNSVSPIHGSGEMDHSTLVADEFHGTWKRRAKATPYGFGLNSSAFTNRQWAILGALGMTLAPRKV